MEGTNGTPAIGLVGVGMAGKRHATAWAKLADRATLAAVADPDEEAGRAVAEALGARYYPSHDEMLAAERLDAVDVCVPPHLVVEIVPAAARAGLHVLCEKPMATTLDEADLVERAIEDAGVTYMAAHNTLFLPTVQRLAELIRRGDLGRVYLIRSLDCFEGPWTVPERLALQDFEIPYFLAPAAWRSTPDLLRGGALIDGGIHALYRLLFVAGAAPVSVVARTRSFEERLGWEGEDTAVLLIDFENGALGEVVVSYAFGPPTSGEDTLLHVVGSEGSAGAGDGTMTFRPAGWAAPARQRLWDVEGLSDVWDATVEAECRHFVDCLVAGTRPIAGLAEARRALSIVRAAYASLENGAVVALDGE